MQQITNENMCECVKIEMKRNVNMALISTLERKKVCDLHN